MADVNKEIGVRIDVITEDVDAANKRIAALDEHIKKLQADIETMRKRGKKSGDEMAAGFKAVEEQAAALPGPIGEVANALGGARQAVAALAKGMVTLKGAIIATGVGALAVALGSLATYFNESQGGAQRLRVGIAALHGVTEVLIGRFEALGKAIVNAFDKEVKSKPFLEYLKDFGNGLVELANNPMFISQAVGRFAGEVEASAKAFAKLADEMNAVMVAERQLSVERAISNKTIAEARLIADDVTKSTDERIAAVRKAGAIEQEVADQEQAIAKQRLAIAVGQFKVGDEEEAQLDKIAQARVRVYELERENIMRKKRLQTEEISLLREASAAKKAIDDAEAERLKALAMEREIAWKAKQAQALAELTLRQGYLAQLSDLQVAAIENEQTREEQAAILAFERKTALIVGQGELEMALRSQLEESLGANLMDIRNKYAKIAMDKADADRKENLAKEQEVAAARMNMAQQTGTALIGIGKIVSAEMADNAEVAKGIATAEVWINAATATASAISKAVQSSATPYDMIANIAVAVATVAGAIASTISILDKAQIPGGAGGSVGAMPSFTSSAPTAAPVSTNVTQLGNTQQAELQTIQAYVVETQITGTQSNIGQIYEQATFGLGG